MEIVGVLFNGCLELLKMPFTVFGFTFSMWQAFLFSALIGIVSKVLWGMFS